MDTLEEEQSPSNILPALMRYKLHMALSITLLLIIGLGVVLLIPPVYRSTGYIMVETQQIPTSLVQSTVTNAAAEQIDIINQRVMTRDHLISIIEKYDYFAYEDADLIEQNHIINSFRNSIDVSVTSAKSGRTTVAIGFSVSFDSDSPAIATAVASDLVKLFLNENLKARTERASETTEFLKSEAEKMRLQLEKTEAALVEFKKKNKDSLPEHLNLYMGMREQAHKSLNDIVEEIAATDNQIKLLKNQFSLSQEQGKQLKTPGELSALKAEYQRLSLQYQPNHPDLILLEEKIHSLESGGTKDSPYHSESERLIESQIVALETKREHLLAEKKTASDKLQDLEQRIINIPQVERGFTVINRNYKTVLAQYESLQAKAQSAAMAESLEQEQKAERFSLLEPPLLPTSPYKPDRKKLLALAIVAALGIPISIVVAIGFLDKSIRSAEAVVSELGSAPLMEIPIIKSEQELKAHKKRLFLSIIAAVVICLLATVTFHFVAIPLDEFIGKAINRFGV